MKNSCIFFMKSQLKKPLRIPTSNKKIINVTLVGCRLQLIGSWYNSMAAFVKTLTNFQIPKSMQFLDRELFQELRDCRLISCVAEEINRWSHWECWVYIWHIFMWILKSWWYCSATTVWVNIQAEFWEYAIKPERD
jgi:hypothetical protein